MAGWRGLAWLIWKFDGLLQRVERVLVDGTIGVTQIQNLPRELSEVVNRQAGEEGVVDICWSPGIALPIGAAYAHYITSEDLLVSGLFKGGTPLFAGSHSGKTGLSESPPDSATVKDRAGEFSAWCRRVRIDLTSCHAYAQAVYATTDAYLSTMPDTELGRSMDLSSVGMGTQTIGFVLNNAVIGHAFCHCGEIAALKGAQGKRGYPF